MSSCKIKYIDNATVSPAFSKTTAEDYKETASMLHIETMRKISSASYKGGLLFSDHVYRNGKRFKTISNYDPQKKTLQEHAIRAINQELRATLRGLGVFEDLNYDPVRIVQVELYKGKPKVGVIVVDLLPYLEGGDSLLTADYLADLDNLEKLYEYMDELFYKGEWIRNSNAYIENLIKQELESSGAVTDQLYNMLDRVDTYVANIIRNPKRFSEFPASLQKNIKDIYTSLSKTKEELEEIKNATGITEEDRQSLLSTKAVERIYTISNFVYKAYRATEMMQAWLEDSIKPMLVQLQNSGDPNYKAAIHKVGNLLQEMTYLINVFTPIEDILISVEKGVDFHFWDEYNTVNIEQGVYDYFFIDKEKQERISEFLNMEVTSMDVLELRMRQITDNKGNYLFTKEDINAVKDIINKNTIATNRPLMNSFRKFREDFSKVRGSVRQAHFDFMATILFNQQVDSYGAASWDDIPEVDKKRLLTIEELKDELSIASKDIDVFNQYLAAGDYIDDAIIRLFFDLMNTPLRLNIIHNTQDRMQSEQVLADQGMSLEDEDGKRKSIEETVLEDITYVDKNNALEVADDDWINEDKPLLFYRGIAFKAKQGKRFIQEYNDHDTVFEKKAFYATLDSRIKDILDIISFDMKNPVYYDKLSSYLKADINLFIDLGYIEEKFDTAVKKNYLRLTSRGKEINFDQFDVKRFLQIDFYSKYYKPLSIRQLLNEYRKYGVASETDFLEELNKKSNSAFYEFFTKNSREVIIEDDIVPIYKNTSAKSFGTPFGKKILIRTKDNKFKFVELSEEADSKKALLLARSLNADSYFVITNELMVPDDRFKNSNYKNIEDLKVSDAKGYAYYDHFYNNYQKANKRLGEHALQYGLLPKIAKLESKDLLEQLKDKVHLTDKLKKYKYISKETIEINGTTLKRQEGDFTYRQVTPNYTDDLDSGVEALTDLYLLDILFTPASRNFESLSTVEPAAKVLRTLFRGNNTLNIEARKAKTKEKNNIVHSTMKQVFKKVDLRSTEAFLKLIDSRIYNYKNDFSVMGLSARKLSGRLKQVVAFQFLANNVKAALTNLSIGATENYLIGAGKRFGLTEGDIRKAYTEYWQNVSKFIGDDFKKDFKDRSLYSQLLTAFDGIKGTEEDGRKIVDPLYTQKKWINRAQYYTQSLPEHLNQSVIFIALYNKYEIAPAVKDSTGAIVKPALLLKDIIEHEPGKAFSFNLAKLNERRSELGLPEYSENEFDIHVKAKFAKKLTRALYEAHGMYDTLDKNLIEDEIVFSFAYLFQRWLYPGIRTKWGKGGMYSPQTGEFEEEGYMRTFFKFQYKEILDIMESQQDVATYLKLRELIKKENLWNVTKVVANAQARFFLGSVVKLSSTMFGVNTPNLDKWLFGEGMEEQVINRLQRAYRFVGIFVGTSILVMGLRALSDTIDIDDDDDPRVKMLNMLRLQAIRLNSDIGFFLSPFMLFDKFGLKYRDPFTIYRSTDSVIGVFKQLLFDYGEEGFNWKGNDIYQNSGPGYEKGDLKVWVRARKAFLAPYQQYIKLLSPEDEIKYMDMIYNN